MLYGLREVDGSLGNVNLGVLNGPTPDNSVGFKINGEAGGDFAGWSVSAAGDVNGDGVDDVIVGATGNSTGGTNAGTAYVVYGRTDGSLADVDLNVLDDPTPDTSVGFKIIGAATDSASSWSVSEVGDVNGDGVDDVIVAAPFTDGGGAYVVYGRTDTSLGNVDLDVLAGPTPDNTVGFKITAEAADDFAGWSVSAAGDVNGDGIDDMIIGALTGVATDYAGAAYVVYGEAGGLSAVDLSKLGGSNPGDPKGFKITGEAANNFAGYSVSAAGDVNGDGIDDVIVGALGNGADYAGAAYVVYGAAGGLTAVDLADVALGSGGFKMVGEAAYDNAGYVVSGAGDVNGDGVDDVIVGAIGGGSYGGAYLVYGAAGGLSTVELGELAQSSSGFKIFGGAQSDGVGFSVSAAGDVNGDGFDDLTVGAAGTDAGTGAAYVVYGDAFTGSVTHRGDEGDNALFGTPGADVMVGAQGNDTLSGAGGDDLLNGASGDDILTGGAGDDRLLGGSGDDLFVFTNGAGDDTVDDFAAGVGSEDVLDLIDFGFADFDAVVANASEVAGDTVIQLDVDDSVTLLGVKLDDLHQDDVLLA